MLFHPLLLKKGYDNSCHRCACGTVYEKLSIAVCNCLEQGTLWCTASFETLLGSYSEHEQRQ